MISSFAALAFAQKNVEVQSLQMSLRSANRVSHAGLKNMMSTLSYG